MRNALAGLAIVATLIPGCAPQPPRPSEPAALAEQVPADFPAQRYLSAFARGEAAFRIDPAGSLLVVEVHRAGSLARLGHDRVIASHDVQGYAAPKEGLADLYVPLDRLVVDEPSLRAEAGFDTQPTEDDIAGTRRNMLTRVLEVERYPLVVVTVHAVVAGNADSIADVSITLHGVTRSTRIPVHIENGKEEIEVSGRTVVNQTDFGITPLSILNGAIQVGDAVGLRFRIRAVRCSTQSCRGLVRG